MARLPIRLTALSIKNPLVNHRLIHVLFALSLTTYSVSHNAPPMFLWSKQCLPTLSEPVAVCQHPARMILQMPRTSCDQFESQTENGAKAINFVPQHDSDMFDLHAALSEFGSPRNSMPPKSPLGPLAIEVEQTNFVLSNELTEVTPPSMPVHVSMGYYKKLKTNESLLEIYARTTHTVESKDPVQVFEQPKAAVIKSDNPIQEIEQPKAVVIKADIPIQEIEQPKAMVHVKRWDTYIVSNPSNTLRLWLQKLAPSKAVPQEEMPFREALIKTLLSEEFQPYIHNFWLEDEDRQEKRTEFFYAYMKNVEWERTPFERLFIVQGATDFHLVDLDAFHYGYQFPKRLGVRIYRRCDIDCREDLL